jgi:enoyl-CoA hydratase
VVLLAFGELDDRFQTVPETAREFLVGPVAKLKQPVIAAMRGDAVGIGLELALACDFRIGTENARFGLPQIREGRIPSNGGTQRLPRLVGQGKAIQMILTGELIDAAEACRIGLINRIVKPESLMSAAMALAEEMAGKSPLACSYAKEALYRGGDLSLDQGLTTELDLYLLLFSTSDRTEGITAFKEKRKPDFKGN